MTRDFWEFDQAINRMWEDLEKDPNTHNWYYGYQVNIGPDGKPQIKEFGNIRPRQGRLELGTREPLVDISVDEKEGTVKLIAEIPGANKENIKVNATENNVEISSKNGGKSYDTSIPLNIKIDPNTADACYTNGILQVTFKKKEPEPPKGVNIKIN